MPIVELKNGWRPGHLLRSRWRRHSMSHRRAKLWRLLCSLLLITYCSVSWAEDQTSIRLCQDSEDVYPWTLKSRPGLNNVLLKMVEAKSGVSFLIISESWRRCQEEMKTGTIDGMFAISFLPERQEFGAYPMRGREPDANKNLMIDGYSLYRRRGDSSVKWDGKEVSINGLIGVQGGYSAVAQLQHLNAKIDAGSSLIQDNLRKLLAGHVAALALRTTEGDSVLATQREFNGKIEKLPIPLVEKPYYLIFSKQFAAAHGSQVQELWNTVELVRNSPEYKAMENAFR